MLRIYHRLAIATVVIFTISTVNAHGQRTMKGQSALEIGASYNGMSAGVSADYSQYTLNGLWYVGIGANDYFALYGVDERMRYDHFCSYGGYLFRLAGTRSRSVCLYGGGAVMIGMEWIDPFGKLPQQFSAALEHYRFLYGVTPKILAEFFVSSRFAFTLLGSIPINFSSAYGNVGFNAGAGFRIML